MASREVERRTGPATNKVEYREDGKTPVITGYAAVFDSESRNLGGFVETISRRAFDKVLASRPDVVGVYNHDKNFLLGRTGNGTMTLAVDDYGLRYAINPPATRADVVESVERGDVVGSSFAFRVSESNGDVWSRRADGTRLREIREIDLLDDVGPVVRPAYGAASVVVSRRALEMALGESFRPSQTMANAAKRGLKLAERHGGCDERLLHVAERIAAREIISVEEVSAVAEAQKRCMAAKTAGWSGSPAWIEWQLAGGDAGFKWAQRRSEPAGVVSAPPEAVEAREADVSLVPSAAMASAARKGLKLHEAGRSGDGLKPETVARAKKIAARKELTPEHVREMRAWFRRHKVDKRPGWDASGSESAGYTAWQLWGGNPAWRWSERKVAQMERASEGRDMMEGEGEAEESLPGTFSPANEALYEAYELIAEEHGKWPQELPDGSHYMAESPFAERGLACSNCLFFEGGGMCEIVEGDIAADGICKLWVISEEKMKNTNNDRSEPAVAEAPETPKAASHSEAPAVPASPPEPDYVGLAAALKLAAMQGALSNHLQGDQ